MLVRLDENSLYEMKWHAREVFAPARHGRTLEALARGLGANSYKGLLTYAQEFGGIMWDGDNSKAIAFLAEREVEVRSGGLAAVVAGHLVEHEHFC